MLETIKPYFLLMRWDRPVGFYLLLWPTLWGVWLGGEGHPSPPILVIFILGVIVMRSAGCVINDLFDRQFDAQISRTRTRPLAEKTVSLFSAWFLLAFLCTLGLLLLLCLNTLAQSIGLLAGVMMVIYPLMKRVTHWPQAVLGLTWYLSIPMAFAAQQNALSAGAFILYGAAALWAVIYDTFYGMVDRPEDRVLGLKSTAILFGQWDRFILALLHAGVFALLSWAGIYFHLTKPYWIALGIAMTIALCLHLIMHPRTGERCFKAFRWSHWEGATVLLGFIFG